MNQPKRLHRLLIGIAVLFLVVACDLPVNIFDTPTAVPQAQVTPLPTFTLPVPSVTFIYTTKTPYVIPTFSPNVTLAATLPPSPTPITITEASSPEVMTTTLKTGWVEYRLPADGFVLAMPPTWEKVDFNESNMDAIVNTLGKSNPELANVLSGQMQTLTASGYKFWGFDLNPKSAQSGYLTNVNVVKQPLTVKASLDFYVQETLAQMKNLSSVVKVVSHKRVKLGQIPAEEMHYQMKLTISTGKTITVATTQYLLLTQEDAFAITFSTSPQQARTYTSTFQKIAASFKLIE